MKVEIIENRFDRTSFHLSFAEARTLLGMLYDEIESRAPELLDEVWLMPKPAAADAVAIAWDQAHEVAKEFYGGRQKGYWQDKPERGTRTWIASPPPVNPYRVTS